MNEARIGDLLREEDAALPTRGGTPPRLEDLERRGRRRTVRRAGGLLLAACAAATLWVPLTRQWAGGAGEVAPDSLTRSMAALESALAALRPGVSVLPSEASQQASMESFRAFHPGAVRGEQGSIESLAWLADRYPRTRGGRCARLFLDRRGPSLSPLDNLLDTTNR